MRIAVLTGPVGLHLTTRLLEHGGFEVTLLGDRECVPRHEAPAVDAMYVETPDRRSVIRATEGMDALFWHVLDRPDADDHLAHQVRLARSAYHAVVRNRIGHLVLMSGFGAHRPGDGGLAMGMHYAEQLLAHVAASVTILRPAYLMENYLDQVEPIARRGRIELPVDASTRLPMVAGQDVARAAHESLVDPPRDRNRIIPLHGPRDYSFGEAAGMIGDSLRQLVVHAKQTPEELVWSLRQRHAGDDYIRQYLQMYEAMERGDLRPAYPRSRLSTTPTSLGSFTRDELLPRMNAAGMLQ